MIFVSVYNKLYRVIDILYTGRRFPLVHLLRNGHIHDGYPNPGEWKFHIGSVATVLTLVFGHDYSDPWPRFDDVLIKLVPSCFVENRNDSCSHRLWAAE